MLFSVINPSDFITLNNIEPQSTQERANQIDSTNQSTDPIAGSQPQSAQPQFHPFERKIEQAFKLMTKTFTFIGPLFTISMLSFIVFTYIAIKKTIIFYYRRKYGRQIGFLIAIISTMQLFYIAFNFILATLIKPGSAIDILKSSYYKTHDPYKTTQVSFPAFAIPLNSREESTFRWKRCKDCNIIKPLRTHHCSICGECVMKMDHHCPWINNCVGQNNQRYFLLFLLFLLSYASFTGGLSIPMIITGEFSRMENEFRFVSVMSIAGSGVLIFFCSWNWFLALNGNTTLEFWGSKAGIDVGDGLSDFNFGNWRDNLFYIFGSRSLLKLIFIPSITKLPFSGLEWSRYVDSNFLIEESESIEVVVPINGNSANSKDNDSKVLIELENKQEISISL